MKLAYRPWAEGVEAENVVVVDGKAARGLHLSHWGGNRTPREFYADTSAEMVMKFLAAPNRESYLQGATEATNNHFDQDGLCALWAILNPEEALARRGRIVDVATTGDFSVYTTDEALRVCATIERLHDPEQSPFGDKLRKARDYLHATEINYREMLPLLPKLLDEIGAYERYWREEAAAFERSVTLFSRGEATVEEAPSLSLSIVRTPEKLEYTALNTYASGDRVIEVVAGRVVEMHYKYYSWVEVPHQPPPRVDLEPLRKELNDPETAAPWTWDGVDRTTSFLRFHPPGEGRGPRGGAEAAVARIRDFLRDHAEDPALRFTPDMLRF